MWEKKEFLRRLVFEWGVKKGLEFNVACLSIMFFTVKSWNFAGLFCRLIAGKGFENRSSAMAGTTTTTSPSTYLTEKREAMLFVLVL